MGKIRQISPERLHFLNLVNLSESSPSYLSPRSWKHTSFLMYRIAMKPRVRSVVQRRFARRSCFGSPDVPAMMGEMMVATTMLIATIVVKNGCFSSFQSAAHMHTYTLYILAHTHIYYTRTHTSIVYIYIIYICIHIHAQYICDYTTQSHSWALRPHKKRSVPHKTNFGIYIEPQEADTFLKDGWGWVGHTVVDFRSFGMLRIHRENYKASNELTISEILKAVLLLGLESRF